MSDITRSCVTARKNVLLARACVRTWSRGCSLPLVEYCNSFLQLLSPLLNLFPHTPRPPSDSLYCSPGAFLSNIANTNCLHHPLLLLSGPLRPCVHQNQGKSPRTWWVHSVLDDCVLECVLMLPFIVLFLFCFVLCVFFPPSSYSETQPGG